MAVDDYLKSFEVYSFIQSIVNSGGEVTLQDFDDFDGAEEELEFFEEMCLLDKDGDKYLFSESGLVSVMESLWKDEVEQDISFNEDVKETLTGYFYSYFENVENSCFYDMLISDFFMGLKCLKLDDRAGDSLEILYLTLSQNYGGEYDVFFNNG